MNSEIKPCPFCGGEAEAYYVIDGSFACSCTSCSYASCAGFNTKQEAIEAWNTRTERTCTDERYAWCMFECSECGCECEGGDYEGHNCSTGAFNYCPNCGARVVR